MIVANAFDDFMAAYGRPVEIVLIAIVTIALIWILRMVLKRSVTRFVTGVKRSQNVDHTSEIEAGTYLKARAVQRTRTLAGVGRHIITWTLVALAFVFILGRLGVNVGAILASAGIVAAGLAFGAQNIIKDILNGIFMVFEDQLGIGDIVTIGDVTGTVEDVGIRVTQVRAPDGTLWFIRNGEILTLGNSSQDWGRAIIDITVDGNEDLAEVSDLILSAAKSLLDNDEYSRKVTGFPEMVGIQSVNEDSTTLQLALRTRPEAQWEVQRAIRGELRHAFKHHGVKLVSVTSEGIQGAS